MGCERREPDEKRGALRRKVQRRRTRGRPKRRLLDK